MCVATVGLVSAGLGAAGAVTGGISKAESASYQAQIARNNAVISQQNASRSASAGAAQTEQAGLAARNKLAEVRASEAANGLDVNAGSAADVQVGEHEMGDLNARTVSNNSALQTYGYSAQAGDYQAQANMDQAEVGYDIAGGVLSGAGAALGSPSVDKAIGFTPSNSLVGSDPSVPSAYSWMSAQGPAKAQFENVGLSDSETLTL